MKDDQNRAEPYQGLPEWPADAKDLPEHNPLPPPTSQWMLVCGATGVSAGIVIGQVGQGGAIGSAFCAILFGFLGAILGYFIDRFLWQEKTRIR